MSNHRVGRASEEIRKELSELMRTLKDPRLDGMLSIVNLDLTNDYSHCTVFISSLEGMDRTVDAVKGLESASGFIRRELTKRLKMRKIPEFHFVADDGIAYSSHLGKIMLDLNKEKDQGENNED